MKKHLLLPVILLLFTSFNSFSQSTSQLLFEKYHMIKVLESEIGVYFARSDDKSKIENLDRFLLSKTDSISSLFNHKLSGRVQFELYPNHAAADFVCGWDTTSVDRNLGRIACAHYINKIQAVMPGVSATADNVYASWGGSHKVILHEYVHSFTYDIVGQDRINEIPFLFAEGIAIYFSEQLYLNTRFKGIIDEKLEKKEVPKFQKLMVNKKFITIPNSYHWAFLFINYMIDSYGWETFLKILEEFEDYNQILKKKDKQINQEWFQYLESKRVKT